VAVVTAMLALAPSARAEEIAYSQILANPDDLKLTYDYARQEARRGRLQRAASSLERLLLLEPEWDSARLFYAIVLYRLDDAPGAIRELEILRLRELTVSQRIEVERYLALAKRRNATTRGYGSVSLGARYDTNRNLAPDAEFGVVEGFEVPLDNHKRDDGAFVSQGSLRLEHSLETGQGDFLFAQADGWLNEQFNVNEQDFLAGRAEAGGTFYSGDFAITPFGFYSTLAMDGDHYLDRYGGGLRLGYTLSQDVTLTAHGVGFYEDYHKTSTSSVGSARDGGLFEGGAGLEWRLDPYSTVTVAAAYLGKDARDDSFAYDGVRAYLSDLTLIGEGQYVLGEFTVWGIFYDAPDPRYDPTRSREDFRLKARIAYGVPLGTVANWAGGELPYALSDITFQVAGAYFYQDSNIANFDFDDFSVEGLLTKRFGF